MILMLLNHIKSFRFLARCYR